MGFKRILISKNDSSGQLQWVRIYHTSPTSNNYLTCITVDDSSNVYLGGSVSFSSNISKFLVLKYNSSGQFIWSYIQTAAYIESRCNDIKLSVSGNIYACGNFYSTGGVNSYFYNVVKLDNSGNELGLFSYSGNTGNYGYPNHLIIDHFNNVFVTGQNKNIVSNNDDGALIKLDSNLNQLWIQTYNGVGNGNDYFFDLALSHDGLPVIVGCENQGASNSSVITIVYNLNGTIKWFNNFSSNNTIKGSGRTVSIDKNGNVYVGAQLDSSGIYSLGILKYDTNGVLNWVRKIIPTNCFSLESSDILNLNDFNVVLVGSYTDSISTNGIIIELDSIGNEIWKTQVFNSNGSNVSFNSLISDSLNNIYVCGNLDNLLSKDLIIQKYSTSIVLKTESLNYEGIDKIFPNPSSKNLHIVQSNCFSKVELFNSQLQIVAEYIFEPTYSKEIDIQEFSPGIYILVINNLPHKLVIQ